MTIAIEADGLVKSFKSTRALDELSLRVPDGTVCGILGPNGAGKTTAIRILATLLRPDKGHATVGGYDVVRQAAGVRSIIGLTGQYAAVDELLSGRENLRLIGRLGGLRKAEAKTHADELLESFELSHAADKAVKTYSGGMRRRIDLAASMVGDPKILFLDEPTTGLDPRSRGQLWQLIRDRAKRGTTVLLTTQYLDEADHLSDELAVIDHGRTVAAGPPAELKSRFGGQRVVVEPLDPSDIDGAVRILGELTTEEATVHTDAQSVSAPINDPAIVPALLRRLEEAGVAVREVGIRNPTLDEVFLALTGPAGRVAADNSRGAGA